MVTTVIRSLFNTEPLGCGGLDNCQDLPMQVTKNADTWTKLGRSKPFIKAAQKNTKAGLRLFFFATHATHCIVQEKLRSYLHP